MKVGKYAKVVVLSTLAETKSLVDISTEWFGNKGRLYQQANIDEIREAVKSGWLIQESKKSYKANTEKEIDKLFVKAKKASWTWSKINIEDRIKVMDDLLNNLVKEKDNIANLITQEIGKPLKQSQLEMEKGFKYIEYYLKNIKEYIGDKKVYEDDIQSDIIRYEPKGIAAVILSWNFPFTLFVWHVIPNFLVGNSVIVKNSSSCVNTSSYLADIVYKSKLPKGVFNNVIGNYKQAEYLLTKDINLICFTGGVATGKHLYKIASEKMITAVLEMGGSNPSVIFEDYPIIKAVKKVVEKRFNNAGQVCNAVKRIIVKESIKDKFIENLLLEVKSLRVGDPFDDNTDIGPLVTQKQFNLLEAQICEAIDKGAKIETGGKRPVGLNGNFYEPTIITNVTKDMRVWQEETFGPVLPIISFKTEKEAIELVNQSPFGMGVMILTEDLKRAQRIGDALDCGMVDINDGKCSKASNPFGGTKKSSIGRVHGEWGFRELTNIKVISISKP